MAGATNRALERPPESPDVAPIPVLTTQRPWSLASFACSALALAFFAAWCLVATVSDSIPLGVAVAGLSLFSALAGAGLALVALARSEGWAALSALLSSLASAVPISPVIALVLLVAAVRD